MELVRCYHVKNHQIPEGAPEGGWRHQGQMTDKSLFGR